MEQPPYDIQRMGKYVGYWISVGYRSRHCYRHGIEQHRYGRGLRRWYRPDRRCRVGAAAGWFGRIEGTVQGGYLPRAYSEEHPTSGAELHNFMSISVHQEDLFIGGM
ncbi:MAG: hypothetical protein O6918_09450 [Deltaproteobacteria bacterium]|nr:hypothetical protein [Deltaproteobacteria bacterium]